MYVKPHVYCDYPTMNNWDSYFIIIIIFFYGQAGYPTYLGSPPPCKQALSLNNSYS